MDTDAVHQIADMLSFTGGRPDYVYMPDGEFVRFSEQLINVTDFASASLYDQNRIIKYYQQRRLITEADAERLRSYAH